MKHTTESIWNLFCCKLKPFIMKWVSDPHVAEDLEQEVFIKIHEKIDSLKDSKKVHSWVLQITRNTVIDYLRKKKMKYVELEDLEAEEDFFDLIKDDRERNLSEEINAALMPMIQALPEKYSQALMLVEFEGLSQVELAKKLNISQSGAKSRIQRGRNLLQDSLLQCCHYEFDKYGTVIGVEPDACNCCNDLNDC